MSDHTTSYSLSFFFFFNDTATTEIYTLSLHDALPICGAGGERGGHLGAGQQRQPEPERQRQPGAHLGAVGVHGHHRSEEHTSELQSQFHLVCRLLLEKKKTKKHRYCDRSI